MSRWQQIEQIFQAATDIDQSLREEFVRKECGGDHELLREVRSLLATHQDTLQDFLDTPAIELVAKSERPVQMPVATHRLVGKQLGNYKLLELLGSGGMGEVYRAQDTEFERELAIKVMPARLASDPNFAARFRREAKLTCSLSHPNIVSVYAIGEAAIDQSGRSETLLFIAMELITGHSLHTLLENRRRLTIPQALDFASQIAAGLACVHSAGIMHRDLKPQNVMIGNDGLVKILDFGLGKRLQLADNGESLRASSADPSTNSGVVIGTIDYMSPQQAGGKKVDFRSDQFSFGAMLYEIVTGHRPFRRATAAQTMAAIIQEQPAALATLNPDVPPALEAIILRCLAKDPEQRFASTAELERELAATRDHPERDLPASFVMPAVLIEKQVAVLPFTNVGGDPAQQLFCDGLAETLASKLTQLEQFQNAFRVIPASELRQESVTSARAARQTFGATVALSGSVQKTGERLRLTLSLMDTVKLRTLGSRTIDTDSNDIALMQDGIVLQAADLFGVKLSIEEQQVLSIGGTTVPEAYKHYLEARHHMQRYELVENLDKALAAFEQAIALDPNYALARAGMGEACWQKYFLTRNPSLVPLARAHSEAALRLNPRMALVHVTLALLEKESGRSEQAIEELNRALKLDPVCSEAYRELALALEAMGKTTEAEATYRRAIAMQPGAWGFHTQLGVFYFRLGRYAEAEAEYRKVVELSPENSRAWHNLGSVFSLQQRYEEAAKAYEKSIEIAPAKVLAYSNLATTYFNQGRYAEAARVYERALQINDRHYTVWRNLAATYLWIPEEKHKAAAAFERAAKLGEGERSVNPNNSRLLMHLADCYSQLGKAERARALLDQALAAAPTEVSVMFNAAIVHEQLGDRRQALRWVGEAVRQGYPRAFIETAPSLAGVRADPGYSDLMSDVASKVVDRRKTKEKSHG